MAMWMYLPDRKLRASEVRDMPKTKACLACGGLLLRVAERAPVPPYPWLPNGWVCESCNTMFMGVGA